MAIRNTRRALVGASAALLAGAWIVLEAAGVKMPPLARHWPLFVLVGGLASIADHLLVSHRPGALGLGVFGVTLGTVLYLLTLDQVAWRKIGTWGPGLYLAVGLGCLAAWLTHRSHPPRLLVLAAVGVGLAVTFWGWGEIPLGLFWGGLLVLLGVVVAIGVVRGGRASGEGTGGHPPSNLG